MIAYAEHQFALERREDDGFTYREILQGLIKRCKDPEKRLSLEEELTAIPFPGAASDIWSFFNELHVTRGNTGFGPSAITWSEMRAWSELRQIRLTSWECEVIHALDVAYLTSIATRKGSGGGES
ncbi:phage tail assembly chaperone [Oceanibaculum indicum]